ncbi:MAG: hydrogen gas-evolving membrane-bound hydrogenase subunit E [Egibacteraceae bacterium]
MLLALLGLHGVLAVVAPFAARRLGLKVFRLCAVGPLLTALYVAWRAPGVLEGEALQQRLVWVQGLRLTLDLRLDAFATVMVALIAGIGTLIFLYSEHYFAGHGDAADHGRFASRLLAFAGAMLGLVLSDNLLVLYVFWELTSITSYLLIGFEDEQPAARAAARQALLTTVAGGLVMLAGFVLIGLDAETFRLSALVEQPPTGTLAGAGALLALVGAFTKSAQVPFHTWLPGAMAAPTPVSAYLHSATMVKAGVYLIARLAPIFAETPGWRPLVLLVGAATMLVGGYRALRQHDLKLLLAYGTVSQLGFMVALFGLGSPEATFAGTVLLLAHGLFKAALFLVTGIVDHQTGTRDLRKLSGLGRALPATAATAIVAAASMAGLPPLFGFVSKEAAYESYLHAGAGPLGVLVLAGLVLGSALTFAYSWRFVVGAFGSRAPLRARHCVGADAAQPTVGFLAPAAGLSALTVAFGLQPEALSHLTTAGAQALDAAVEEHHLALWHGFTLPLLLSAITIALGVALVVRRRWIEQWQERALVGMPGAQEGYGASLRGVNLVADTVTGTLQNGSLPIYLGVILLALVGLPGWSLLSAGIGALPDKLAENPLQLAVGLGAIVAALGTIYARQRFAAVLFLGAVGYSVAMLFVIQGAPDLALTQFLIETLSLVIFVLVLRHLPMTATARRWSLGQNIRRFVSVAVGLFVTFFALAAGAARTARPVSDAYIARSVPDAHGHNVVNVILVDFRGFDTFGEITVLTVAALGIAGFVLAVRPKAAAEEAEFAEDQPAAVERAHAQDPPEAGEPAEPQHSLPHGSAPRRSSS